MAIDKTKNTTMSLTVPIELKEKIKILAKEESRSANSFIVNAVKEYIKNNHSDN